MSGVSTIVWLHDLDSKERLGEKVRCEVHKDVECCFEKRLEVELVKTTAVWPPTTHLKTLTVRRTRHAGYCQRKQR